LAARGSTVVGALILAYASFATADAWGWQTVVGPHPGFVTQIAADASGDVLAVGQVEGNFAAAKLRATDGAVVWRSERGNGTATALVVVGSDVVVGGWVDSLFTTVLAKLSTETGGEIWSTSVSAEFASQVTLDHAGDVIITAAGSDVTVVKVSGSTGAELWRHTEHDAVRPATTAVDTAGDVVVGLNPVIKLSGAGGEVLWSRQTGASTRIFGFVVDASGDVVASLRRVSGEPVSGKAVSSRLVKLSGATGEIVWKTPSLKYPKAADAPLSTTGSGNVVVERVRQYHPRPSSTGYRHTVIALRSQNGRRLPGWAFQTPETTIADRAFADAAGDVYVASTLGNRLFATGSILTKLRRRTGKQAWARPLRCDGKNLVAVDVIARGSDVFAGGFATTAFPPDDTFAVVQLSADTGAE
jgi:outer membrane protein assembly factor BamB